MPPKRVVFKQTSEAIDCLEDVMALVHGVQLSVDEARTLCKKLQDQIDKATKLLSSKSFDGTFDESTIAYLSTRGSKQIADILNGVRVEKVSK